MTPERWERITDIFSDIQEANPEDRLHLLSQVDEHLREDVARLLADDGHADQSGLMNTPLLQPGTLFASLNEPRMFDPGRLLANRFEIRGMLGRGGMGEVYEAIDVGTGQQLAIKAVRHEYRHDEEVLRRFRTEPQRAALVNHPNVCRVFEALEDETPFFTMELLHGVPLEQHLSESGPAASLEIALAICAGLDAVHRVGLVHRDLKTANVMLLGEPGRCAVLTDFGIAREAPVAGGAHTMTGTGEFAGTLAYLAPELLEGCRANSASDIYALGVVLFRMVTGHYPFEATADLVSASMRILRPAPSPRVHTPNLPGCWETAIAACLEREPARRPANALTVARLLEDSGTVRLALRRRQVTHTLTRRGAIAAAATATAGLAGTAGWRWWNRPPFEGRKVRILVEDFTSSDPGGALGRAVRNIVRLRLGATPVSSVVRPDEVLKAVGELNLGTRPLRGETALELSRHTKAQLSLRGTIDKTAQGHKIRLEACAAASGNVVTRGETTADGQSSLVAAAERVCAEVYARLSGRPISDITSPLQTQQVNSISGEAFEKFTAGLEHLSYGETDNALSYFKEATTVDPEFGLAFIYLSLLSTSVRRSQESFTAAMRAYALRERLTPRQRRQADLMYYIVRGDADQALDIHQKLVSEFPTEAALQRSASHAYAVMNFTQEALQHGRIALELEPRNVLNYFVLGSTEAQAGKFTDAVATLEKGRRIAPNAQLLNATEADVRLLQGDLDSALASLRRMETDSSAENRAIGRAQHVDCLMVFGRFEEALVLLEGSPKGYQAQYALGSIYSMLSKRGEAAAHAESLAESSADPWNVNSLRAAAAIAHEIQHKAIARHVMEKMNILDSQFPSRRVTAQRMFVTGIHHELTGDLSLAENAFTTAHDLRSDILHSWTLATHFEKRDSLERAFSLYKSVVDRKGMAIRFEFPLLWIRSVRRAARCCEALGRRQEAQQYMALFLRHWGTERREAG